MKKNHILSASALVIFLGSNAVAGNFYIGPTLIVKYMSALHSSAYSVSPRMSVGYGTALGKYYIGGELTASPFSATFSSSQDTGPQNAKTVSTYGFSVIPGIKISDKLLGYLRLGVVSTNFDGPNTTVAGLIMGAGCAIPLNENWDFRVEYNYSSYRSVAGLGSPKSSEIGLGAIYKFNLG